MSRQSRFSAFGNRPFDPDMKIRSLRLKKQRTQGMQALYVLLLVSSIVLLGWAFREKWSAKNRMMCAGFFVLSATSVWGTFASKKKLDEEIGEMERLKEHLNG